MARGGGGFPLLTESEDPVISYSDPSKLFPESTAPIETLVFSPKFFRSNAFALVTHSCLTQGVRSSSGEIGMFLLPLLDSSPSGLFSTSLIISKLCRTPHDDSHLERRTALLVAAKERMIQPTEYCARSPHIPVPASSLY